jgi:hypothetical protein
VIRASSAASVLSACLALAASGAAVGGCGSRAGDEAAGSPSSPCVAFAKAAPLALTAEPRAVPARPRAFVRLVRGAGRTYALDAAGDLGRLDAAAAETVAVPLALDFAVARSAAGVVHAFVARWTTAPAATLAFELTRYTSRDDGLTFDPTSAVALLEGRSDGGGSGGSGGGPLASLAFGPDGLLYLALGEAGPSSAGLDSIFGKVLRVDVSGDTAAVAAGNPVSPAQGRAEIWAVGIHRPRGLDVDAVTGAVWLTDDSATEDATVVHRLVRGSVEVPKPILTIAAAERRAAFSGGHVHRGARAAALAGKYVYPASGSRLVAVDAFGPSGTAQSSLLEAGAEGPFGRIDGDELVVATASSGVARIVAAPAAAPAGGAPSSLLATRCFDLAAPSGVPSGAVAYDVTTPLWSDGATKDRFVVVPQGAPITARPDGDLVFPVGTVAVKTFAVDGRRIETRLLVQHELEDWTGYSYAWNEAGTDAEIVTGNRVQPLAGGKSWYFPSSTDCTACHTPAAGYTLGLEAKQLAGHGDALARLAERVAAPVRPTGAPRV